MEERMKVKKDKEKDISIKISSEKKKLNFSTSYLTQWEQIILAIKFKYKMFTNNAKTLKFIFLSPLVFCILLTFLNYLYLMYSNSLAIIDHPINEISRNENLSLKCGLGYPKNCISIGIVLLGSTYDKVQLEQIDYVMASIANQTGLVKDEDVKIVSTGSMENFNNYIEENPNKIQYGISFCLSTYMIGTVEIPCKADYISPEKFHMYSILYNITNTPSGFLESFEKPMPIDEKLLKLKVIIDNAYLTLYSNKEGFGFNPKIEISHQGFPSPINRFVKGNDIIPTIGVFYFVFPELFIFCVTLLELVREKELSLKKYSHLYGLSHFAYWVSWILISIWLCATTGILIIVFGTIFNITVFTNSNVLITFILFFSFGMAMQFLAYFISCLLESQQSANTVAYTMILVAFVMQCLLGNYGLVYSLYNIKANWWTQVARYGFHLYPPFIFAKCYLDVARISSFHFDSPSMSWQPGQYYGFSNFFSKTVGKLQIGIQYNVDSFFESILCFYIFIGIMLLLLLKREVKCSFWSMFLRVFNSCLKYQYNYSEINKKKEEMESEFFKESSSMEMTSLIKSDRSLSARQDSHQSVKLEKEKAIRLNTNRNVPSGLRIMGMTKLYESHNLLALDDVFLEITKGEVLTILGPNGAGKSTLLNILTCQLDSTHGFAKVGPFIIKDEFNLDTTLFKRLLGVCSQFDYLWDELTVYDNLYYYSRLRGIKESTIHNYINIKLREVNLEEKSNTPAGKLSGGMRRRLSICISTLGDPYIIFMDEPTTGLDPNNRRKIWKLINNLKMGRVIILTTHMMDEAEYLSDRIGIIVSGKLRFIGNCTELRNTYFNGVILTLKLDLIVSNIKYIDFIISTEFPSAKVQKSEAGVYILFINKTNKSELAKALQVFNKNGENRHINDLVECIKDVAIGQSNLENFYLQVCKVYGQK